MKTLWPGLSFARSLSALPRRESNHRDRGRLQEVQIARLVRGGVLRHDRKLGERARAEIKDTREDGIARLEASHATSHLHHDTRQIAAQRGRKLKLEHRLKRSFRNHVINRIQASGVDLNEHFVRLERRPGNDGERDMIRSAVTFEDKCFHVFRGFQTFANAL